MSKRVVVLCVLVLSLVSVEVRAQVATRIASGLSSPVLATAPAGDGRLFILEKAGRIRIYKAGEGVLPTPFLAWQNGSSDCAATDCTDAEGEGGLLGLAFSPNYENDGFFYIYYTAATGTPFESRITRFQVSADRDIADPATETVMWTLAQPANNHNGGTLAFHPTDGLLYLATGDGGSSAATAQNDANELGKVLRFDLSQWNPPALLAPQFPYYAKGLRNPFRWSFDRATGDLYIGDVGEQTREEVNVLPNGSAAGINFGWPTMEGSECLGGGTNCNMSGLTLPVVEYDHNADNVDSITGGSVYRGPPIAELDDGEYLHTDFGNPFMNVISWPASTNPMPTGIGPDIGAFTSIAAISEDGFGRLHIVDLDGEIFRVPEPAAPFAAIAALFALRAVSRRQRARPH